jgi:hypothetical protein
MDTLHEMLLADEILFCGLVLLCGVLAGALARGIAALCERSVA